MDIIDELLAQHQAALVDPARIMNLKRTLVESGMWEKMGGGTITQKKNTPPPPPPTADAITAIRAGLWDNWPTGTRTKNHPNQYALSLDIWDAQADDIEARTLCRMNQQFRGSVSLMGAKALRSQIRNLRKPRANELSNVDPDYLDGLADLSAKHPEFLIGMVNTNIRDDASEYHRGVYYHPYCFVVATMEDGKVASAKLFHGDYVALAPFVDKDCEGAALKGVVAQSRLDRCGFDAGWASN